MLKFDHEQCPAQQCSWSPRLCSAPCRACSKQRARDWLQSWTRDSQRDSQQIHHMKMPIPCGQGRFCTCNISISNYELLWDGICIWPFKKNYLFKKIQGLCVSSVSDKEEYIPLLREGICQLLLHNITQKIALINHPWHYSLKERDVSQRQHINKKERDNEFSEISRLCCFWMKTTFNC